MRKLKRMLVAVFLLLNCAVLYSQTTASGVVTFSANNKPIQAKTTNSEFNFLLQKVK